MKNMINLFSKRKPITTGQVIKAYRKAFKYSQSQLADLIGSSQGNVSGIESGNRDIGLDVAVRFCAIFNINLEDLLFPDGIENSNEFVETRKKVDQLPQTNKSNRSIKGKNRHI